MNEPTEELLREAPVDEVATDDIIAEEHEITDPVNEVVEEDEIEEDESSEDEEDGRRRRPLIRNSSINPKVFSSGS
jgi:hypothetical protein